MGSRDVQGRSGNVALPRVKVVVRGLAWLIARKAERAADGRSSVVAMISI